jgi:(6-4)DNA photolyase
LFVLTEDNPPKLNCKPDGGAEPNFLNCRMPLPPAYWGEESGLAWLDHVMVDVWAEGYSHHITRLMDLSNLATLLDVHPREITDWFWVAYTDAYDWIVKPNVLAMGTFAVGELMTTKPYISGAAYINRMSHFCPDCRCDPMRNCPITNLYLSDVKIPPFGKGGRGDFLGEPGSEIPPAPL